MYLQNYTRIDINYMNLISFGVLSHFIKTVYIFACNSLIIKLGVLYNIIYLYTYQIFG